MNQLNHFIIINTPLLNYPLNIPFTWNIWECFLIIFQNQLNIGKIFAKHERQGNNVTQKDEIGFTAAFANQVQLEPGFIYRIGRYNNTKI